MPLHDMAALTIMDQSQAVANQPQSSARTMATVSLLDPAEIWKFGNELALIDAADGGSLVREMRSDAGKAAVPFEVIASLMTEVKGACIPMGPNSVTFPTREPVGVVARAVAFNHPFMVTAAKAAVPLADGNSVIVRPPEVASPSALRVAEVVGLLFSTRRVQHRCRRSRTGCWPGLLSRRHDGHVDRQRVDRRVSGAGRFGSVEASAVRVGRRTP